MGLKKEYVASTDWSYAAALRELRCAFACGSGMVELYSDYDLMNSIEGGALWADLAECIKWQEKNADVLPDIHWVGGAPYDGSHHVYGWASWNGKKVTLALRNGGTSTMSYSTTLREVFEIPAYIKDVKITLTKAFSHSQNNLSGLSTGTAIDIDQQLTLSLPASTVFVFDGVQTPESSFEHVPTEPELPQPVVVEIPVFSIAGGEVEEGTKVTISCATEGATVYYTTDGTEPTTASAVYSGEITVNSAMTIKAMAAKSGNYTNSAVASASYTIKAREVVATPAFSIAGGEVEEGTKVTITCATEGATVYYTTDGTTPTASSAVYNGAITVNSAMTIKAFATKEGYYTNSAVATAAYTIKTRDAVAMPVISPAGGEVEEGTEVTITCATEDAVIYYTTDGTTPTASSAVYNGAIAVNSAMTIKAMAAKEGYYTNSAVAAAEFTVYRTVDRLIKVKAEHKFGTCILPFSVDLPSGLNVYICSKASGDYIILAVPVSARKRSSSSLK